MKHKTPKVSVGMPVYNGGEFIDNTIETILNQTFQDFELIISDNASTDNTEEICRKYALTDGRIRYYRNKTNIGASDNYNAVFNFAKGSYFKWASSNDLCGQDFLFKCVEVLEKYPNVVVCYPKTKLFQEELDTAEEYDDNLHLLDSEPSKRFIKFIHRIGLNNVMNGLIRSSALKKTKLVKTFFSSDICMMAELALYGKFFEIPEFLFFRRMDPETATHLKSEEEVLRHYDPDLKSLMLFQYWKIAFEYFKILYRSPLPVREKNYLYRHMVKWVYWHRGFLSKDVELAVRKFLIR